MKGCTGRCKYSHGPRLAGVAVHLWAQNANALRPTARPIWCCRGAGDRRRVETQVKVAEPVATLLPAQTLT